MGVFQKHIMFKAFGLFLMVIYMHLQFFPVYLLSWFLMVYLFFFFQEVDRFQDLEEELKLRGYNGIWKVGIRSGFESLV